MTIGDLIKRTRETRGLSQGDLARLSGISQGGISRIEAGERQPGAASLYRIVVVLDLNPALALQAAAKTEATPAEAVA